MYRRTKKGWNEVGGAFGNLEKDHTLFGYQYVYMYILVMLSMTNRRLIDGTGMELKSEFECEIRKGCF